MSIVVTQSASEAENLNPFGFRHNNNSYVLSYIASLSLLFTRDIIESRIITVSSPGCYISFIFVSDSPRRAWDSSLSSFVSG